MNDNVINNTSIASDKQTKLTQRQLGGLMGNLVVVFILGVALSTVVNYQPDKHSVVQTTILILHIVAAIGVLAQGITRLVFAVRWKKLVGLSVVGLASIVIALISGSASAGTGDNWAVFIMAMGFIAAFAAYGMSFRQVS